MAVNIGKLSSKGNVAEHKLNAIGNELYEIRGTLELIEKHYKEILPDQATDTINEYRVAPGMPKRIIFDHEGLAFYIDLTITSASVEGSSVYYGNIIYGALRSKKPCNRTFPFPWEHDEKPFFTFKVHGCKLIQTDGSKDDEWIPSGDDNSIYIKDLHFRAMSELWDQALEWVNEHILP